MAVGSHEGESAGRPVSPKRPSPLHIAARDIADASFKIADSGTPVPRNGKRRSSAPEFIVPDVFSRSGSEDCSDGCSSAGLLGATGYLIRLAHSHEFAAQDKGILLGDRGALPIWPKAEAPRKKCAVPVKPAWPFDAPLICVGARVRIGKAKADPKIGIVDRWLPGKSKWAVTLESGKKQANTTASLVPLCSDITRGMKVTVVEEIEIAADPDDPDDQDVFLKSGTRGVITELDDDDGGAFMEFETYPTASLPIEREHFKRMKFFQESLGIWAYFDDDEDHISDRISLIRDVVPSDLPGGVCLERVSEYSDSSSNSRMVGVDAVPDLDSDVPSKSSVTDTAAEDATSRCTSDHAMSAAVEDTVEDRKMSTQGVVVTMGYDTNFIEVPAMVEDAEPAITEDGPQWTIEQSSLLCGEGGEARFEGKARLLSKTDFHSAAAAVEYLNAEGCSTFPEGFCVVFSCSKKKYFLLYRRDQKTRVFELFNLAD